MTKITKAVFPVAGLGTRFLPATKANPKEMLPIVDKPLIQYAVEEAIAAGIKELIFVTSNTKRAIEDHFDTNFELETKLAQQHKTDLLKIVQDILPKDVSCAYIRQPEALGLGHAILCAKPLISKGESFAILLADDLIDSVPSCLSQMLATYELHPRNMIAVEKIPYSETDRYGIISQQSEGQITKIIEKPPIDQAPSNLGVVGRYVLSWHIFACLEKIITDHRTNEIQLTDGIAILLQTEPVYAYALPGKRYDCGSKMGYLEATVQYALQHSELSTSFKAYLKNLLPDII